MTDDEYCGFMCSDVIERQKRILEDIKDFSVYNREYAVVMFGKCMEMVYYASQDLPKIPKPEENIAIKQ